MYLRHLYIENNGPLRKLTLELPFAVDGAPIPVVLVGENGSGKTNLLSIIADALFEAAAVHYTDIVPNASLGSRPWFRVSGATTISVGATGSCALLLFQQQEASYVYKEKGGILPAKDVHERLPEALSQYASWPDDGSIKEFSIPEDESKRAFEQGPYLYFPSSRAETPHWLNRNSLPADDFDLAPRYTKQLRRPIYVERGLQQLKQWILSILIEIRTDFVKVPTLPEDNAVAINVLNALAHMPLWTSLNEILKEILNDKSARLVWTGRRSPGKIGFLRDGTESTLPLEALSAGQATLLNVFGTLLWYGDGITGGPSTHEQIVGICLIDEIDAHMHVDLQHRALPKLMQMFPRVQFIVSSHSPLFVLGVEKAYGENKVAVIEMPLGLPIQAEAYAEFGRALEVFQDSNALNQAMLHAAGSPGKLLVLLEGETDPMYLMAAAELLGRSSLLDRVEFAWVGAKDPKNGQGFHTGKDALNATASVLRAKPELIKRPVLLLYDNDASKTAADYANLHIRPLPTNPTNTAVEDGIENLLPAHLLTEEMFNVETKKKRNGNITTIKSLNKMKLCKSVCESKRDPSDFTEFGQVLEIAETIAKLHGLEKPNEPIAADSSAP